MCFCQVYLSVPFVTVVLFDPSEQDEEIRKIQAAIAAGMTSNAGHLQTYLKTWDKYRAIWERNQDSFIEDYRGLNKPVTTFDADIHRHSALKYSHHSSRSFYESFGNS